MSALTYNNLALDWTLPGQHDRRFQTLTGITLALVLGLAMFLSALPVSESERREHATVPDRVARFVAERPKPPPPPVEVQPRLAPPPPAVETAPTIQRERPREVELQPLTEAQKTARERAQNSGLLALHNELSTLMDTSELNNMVGGPIGDGDAAASAGHGLGAITTRTAQSGSQLSSGQYGSQIGSTTLSERDIVAVQSGLFADGEIEFGRDDESTQRRGNDSVRAREDVTITFDQNKGALYALYARERRRSPDLEGRIVLRITIAPSGEVTDVQVVSSELNSPSLESGIIGRIKMFRFDAMDVDELTVTYPIEFLPS